MKPLKQLEEAGLIVTKRRGREKLHFLNPVPIRLVYDRWVSKYTETWAAGLVALKRELESDTMEKIFEIYIRTTPERLWAAITDPDTRARFQFGATVTSDWTAGSAYVISHANADRPLVDGTNLDVDAPRRRPSAAFPVRRDRHVRLDCRIGLRHLPRQRRQAACRRDQPRRRRAS